MRRSPMVSVVELREVSTSSACEVTSTTSLPPADGKRDRQFDQSADRDRDAGVLNLGEAGHDDGDRVGAGRKQSHAVSALAVAVGGALQALGDFLRGDGRIGDAGAFGIFYGDVQIAGRDAALREDEWQKSAGRKTTPKLLLLCGA